MGIMLLRLIIIILIKLEHIFKIYEMGENKVYALDDVSLHVAAHEFVSIIGPSGSGKSTLMNMLGCLDVPTQGRYFLDGTDISKKTDDELAEIRNKKIGFVFQAVALIPIMNAYENVDFAMRLAEGDLSPNAVDARIRETLALVGMEERMLHLPGQMSGGEQQRVAIARAVAHRPKVVFADEPTGALDSKSGKEVLKLFRKLNDMGNTIVMITHNINDSVKYASHIMHIGKNVFYGTKQEYDELKGDTLLD